MKKFVNTLLLVVVLIFMCSFKVEEQKVNHLIDNSKMSFEIGDRTYSYSMDNGYFFKLETKVKENYQYRIVIEDLKLTLIAYDDYGMLYGYGDDDKLICETLSEKEKNILVNKCNLEIKMNSPLYSKLNEFFNEYLKLDYEKRSANQIAQLSNDVPSMGIYDLSYATSYDTYLDGYEPKHYDIYGTDQGGKGDDPIVNIVPKQWFFSEGSHNYVGKEYAIHMSTYLVTDVNNNYYRSEVMVIDFDFSDPNYTCSTAFPLEINGGIQCTDTANNLIIDVVINDVYFSLEYSANSSIYDQLDINKSFEQVVLHNLNYREPFIGTIPSLRYVELSNLGYYLENNSNDEVYIESIEYGLEINSEAQSVDNSDEVRLVAELYLSSLEAIPFFGTIVAALEPAYDTLTLIRALQKGFDEVVPYEDRNKVDVIPDDSTVKHTINTKSTNNDVNVLLLELYSFYQKLKANSAINYKYVFQIKDFLHTMVEANHDRTVSLKYKIKDSNGNYTYDENTGDNCFFYTNVTENISYVDVEYKDENGDFVTENHISNVFNLNNLEFNVSSPNFEEIYYFESSESGVYAFTIPYGSHVIITDLYGRVVASSITQHGNLPLIFVKFEANVNYFIAGGIDSLSTNSFKMKSLSFGNASYNDNVQNYYVSTNTDIVGFKLFNPSYYSIYSMYTQSNVDPRIFIFNERGGLVAFNDNDSYQPSEDYTEYNSSLDVCLPNDENFYIIVTHQLIPVNSMQNVKLNIQRWTEQ